MLQILNRSKLRAGLALQSDVSGADVVSVVVKATFALPAPGGSPELADVQAPISYEDQRHGNDPTASIVRPADIVLGKLGTDVGVVGHAHAPGGRPAAQVLVSLTVGELQRAILVHGDRHWDDGLLLARITPPAPLLTMPLRLERAFGGAEDRRNPVGTGLVTKRADLNGHRLPNLEEPSQPIRAWTDRPPVACFGFLDGGWEPRCRYTGTLDARWRRDRFPLLPADFDLRYFHVACAGLTSRGFLRGGEPVALINLCSHGDHRFALPRLDVTLSFRLGAVLTSVRAVLWTVVFEPDLEQFYMVWGASFRVGKQPSRLKYVQVEAAGPGLALDLSPDAPDSA